MIRLQTSLIWPGCAQGKYTIKAKGYILAVLRWGTAAGPLPGLLSPHQRAFSMFPHRIVWKISRF